jgi:hypothetical protein
MNLQVDRNTARPSAETRRLWDDARVWVVNCVAIESTWLPAMAKDLVPDARRTRDAMLASLVSTW